MLEWWILASGRLRPRLLLYSIDLACWEWVIDRQSAMGRANSPRLCYHESRLNKAPHMRSNTFAVASIFLATLALSASRSLAEPNMEFARDVAPIFERHCIRCHQPGNAESLLSLATSNEITERGYLVPGDPQGSYLLEVVTSAAGEPPLMPKEGPPLSENEIATLRAWIAAGAVWPADFVVRQKPQADRSWWSLRPLAAVGPPTTDAPQAWRVNPIDAFTYAQLAANKLRPNPRADRRTLIRRLSYDLTGLPPTAAEADAFVNDPTTDAYERLVDRLLASPRYGEHWGRHWLDVVRFGESTGFEVNHIIDNAWQFRDYVIRAFNDDKPFDRLVTEHLAGDAVGSGDAAVEVGLAFLVCGPTDIVGNADAAMAAQIRADTVDEIIRATGEAFLGLTVGCARCHDHKFDPITQQDYYRLYATFAGVFHGDRHIAPSDQLRDREQKLTALEARKKQLADEQAALRRNADGNQQARLDTLQNELAEVEQRIAALPSFPLLRVGRFEQPAEQQHIFVAGDASRKGAAVVPASIETLAAATTAYDLPGDTPEQERRLALARWIVADNNPLTPRVLVNRLWHYHFGRGIVGTPSDFGYMGEKPSHPELLDWLAKRLVDERWHLKPLHKLIVMSETYQQSSAARDDALGVDAESRLLWRFPPRRLGAEEIRDTMLLLAGQLDERMGGPGFRLYDYARDNVATYTPRDSVGPETFRRAVYHQNARASRIDVLTDFDAPDCAFSIARRVPTTTPLQALALMNHKFTMQMAEHFAARLAREAEASGPEAQVALAFRLAFSREPELTEQAAAIALVEEHGLRAFCRALLNSNEMIYVD